MYEGGSAPSYLWMATELGCSCMHVQTHTHTRSHAHTHTNISSSSWSLWTFLFFLWASSSGSLSHCLAVDALGAIDTRLPDLVSLTGVLLFKLLFTRQQVSSFQEVASPRSLGTCSCSVPVLLRTWAVTLALDLVENFCSISLQVHTEAIRGCFTSLGLMDLRAEWGLRCVPMIIPCALTNQTEASASSLANEAQWWLMPTPTKGMAGKPLQATLPTRRRRQRAATRRNREWGQILGHTWATLRDVYMPFLARSLGFRLILRTICSPSWWRNSLGSKYNVT